MLSLNASIEATRVDKDGQSFAMVANEIKKLSQTRSKSASDISSHIKEINRLVSNTVEKADYSINNINESSNLVSNDLKTFDIIFEKINMTNSLIKNMNEKVFSLNDVATMVAAISEE